MSNSFKIIYKSFYIALILILPFLFTNIYVSAQEDQPIIVQGVNCQNLEQSAQIEINTSLKSPEFLTYELQSPDRIIIDFMDTVYSDMPAAQFFKEGLVTSIEIAVTPGEPQRQINGKSFSSIDFIVVTLRKSVKYVTDQQELLIAVKIGDFQKKSEEAKIAPEHRPQEESARQEESVSGEIAQPQAEIKSEPQQEEAVSKEETLQEEINPPQAPDELKKETNLDMSVEVTPKEEGAAAPVKETPAPENLHRESMSATGPEIAGPEFILLDNLECKNLPNSAKVSFISDKPIDVIAYETDNTLELFVDVATNVFSKIGKDLKFDEGILSEIRILRKDAGLPAGVSQDYYPVDFMVFAFNKPVKFEIIRNQDEVSLNFIGGPEEAKEAKAQEVKEGPKKEEPKEESKEVEPKKEEPKEEAKAELLKPQVVQEGTVEKAKGEDVSEAAQITPKEIPVISVPPVEKSLMACIQVALETNRAAKIAKEEIELARLKLRDAMRGLFPSATLKSSWTKGSNSTGAVTTVGYVERSYGVEIAQPVYSGGKLRSTAKQTKVSLEISKKKFDKVEADTAYDVAQNYYELISAKATVVFQEELLNQVGPSCEDAKRRFVNELITEIDYMNIDATYKQIMLQVETARRDLDLAKLKLKHAINAKDLESFEIPSMLDVDYMNKDIRIEEAFKLALDNRPEIYMDRLLIDFNKYEMIIARSKDDFKLDFTGFYGRSGDAFTDDDFKRHLDWYAGFKLSKPFFGNTLGYSWTKNSTAAKLGQSSRTHGMTESVEMNVLNTLSNATEVEQAKVGYEKSLSEYDDTVKATETEVQEAYNAYEKAVMQVDNEREKVKIKEKQLIITQYQESINEESLAQLIDAKSKLVDEKISYIQAVSAYKVAIAKLNKAIGIRGYYK